MPPTKSQRWLDLISLLLGRRVPLTVEEIMERMPAYADKWESGDQTAQNSARRAFERDKDELRKMGIPLKSVSYDINYGVDHIDGYRIEYEDFYLPYIRLLAGDDDSGSTPTGSGADQDRGTGTRGGKYRGLASLDFTNEEAALALDALRRVESLPGFPFAAEARAAHRKLTFDIDAGLFPGAPIIWVDRPGAEEIGEHLRILTEALQNRKRVRFTYHGITRDASSERDVAPYGIFFQRDWYLVGNDTPTNAVKIFRVSRMEKSQANHASPRKPDYEIPEDFALSAYLDRSAWELGSEETVRAEVRFRFPHSLIAERNREGELVRTEADGDSVRAFDVARDDPFIRWILSFGGDAEIISPPEFRDALESMAREVEELYIEEATHG